MSSYDAAQRALNFYGPVPGTDVAYDYELAGPDGASFWVFREPHHTDSNITSAKQRLRADHDVIGTISVIRLDRRLVRKASAVPSDVLDFAYFCFGLRAWMQNHPTPPGVYDGELEFVNACLPYVKHLDTPTPEEGYAGVFCYEVAEPFGERVAAKVAADECDDAWASEQAKQLIAGMSE